MTKVLVNVHGAGKQMSDFYKEALTALTGIMHSEPACMPCWYADLTNIGSPVLGAPDGDLPPEAEQLRNDLTQDLIEHQKQQDRERQQREGATAPASAVLGVPSTEGTLSAEGTLGLMDIPVLATVVVSEVVRYIFDTSLQSQIKQRLSAVLAEAAKQYDETVLVSHSLGTVVAFDVLHDEADRHKISRFVTMGCPLRKLVNLRRRSSDLGAINEKTVPFWRNLYDTTDVVADAIGPAFPGYPLEDVFIQVADLPIPSHDYWRNNQVLNMIAGWLQ